jgi:hypothetical protein
VRRLHVALLLARTLVDAAVPAARMQEARADRLALRLAAEAGARLLWKPSSVGARPAVAGSGRARLAVWRSLALDDPLAAAGHVADHLLRPGANDWGAEGSGCGGVAAHLWRRQARIWSRERRHLGGG